MIIRNISFGYIVQQQFPAFCSSCAHTLLQVQRCSCGASYYCQSGLGLPGGWLLGFFEISGTQPPNGNIVFQLPTIAVIEAQYPTGPALPGRGVLAESTTPKPN